MPSEEIGQAYRKVLHDNLAKMRWSEEKIGKGIEIAGRVILTAARLSEIWQTKQGDRAVLLLEKILTESTTIKEATDAMRGYGMSCTSKGNDVLAMCRGMLLALGGRYDMPSPLDDASPMPLQPPESSTIYWREWATKSNP